MNYAATATTAAPPLQLKRTLGALSLAAVVFFNVSGGPFSTEGLVADLGPGLALLMLLLVPLVWAVPETLIVGELGSMLPEEGGYYRWVKRAFGPYLAFQNGWITWVYSLVDMAIYPVLFNTYLAWFFPGVDATTHWYVSLAVIWGATAINLRGALSVAHVSIACGLFILGAFIAMALLAVPNLQHVPWQPFATSSDSVMPLLAVGLSTALWNYIGWDNASTVNGEVIDATHNYPRALFRTLALVTACYFAALLPALSATDWRTWQEGGWPAIAAAASGPVAGPFIANWIALAGMASAIGLYMALLLSYSRIPLALADDGYLPHALAVTDARGTPRNAVLASAVCYSVFALLPFAHLVVADVLLYAAAVVMELASLVRLRMREPELRGAFRIPLGTAGVAALATLPAVVLLSLVWLSLHDGEYALPALVGAGVAVALGTPLYFWRSRVAAAR